MEEFIDMLNESLQPEITDFFGIQISTAIVTTWGIMAVLMILTLIFVRNLKVIPTSKSQIVVEMLVKFINDFFIGILGEEGKQYVPYLGTVLIYIVVANISGIFGVVSPTKDLNVTAALAIMSIILIEFSGIRKKGIKGWLKSFIEPMPI